MASDAVRRVFFSVCRQVVGAEAQIEHVARLHAVRIVVVVLLAGEVVVAALGQRQQLGGNRPLRAVRVHAVRDRIVHRGEHAVAGQADRHLLIRRQAAQRRARIRNTADHQPAVKALGESDPLGVLRALVAQVQRGLERLVVIDAEHARGQRRALRDQTARFRREVPRARVPERPVGLEALADWWCSPGP